MTDLEAPVVAACVFGGWSVPQKAPPPWSTPGSAEPDQPAQAAAVAAHARLGDREQLRDRVLRQGDALLVAEVRDQLGAVGEVGACVVLVHGFLGEPAPPDLCVDRSGRRVRLREQRLGLESADESAVDLDPGLGPGHLQVEDHATRAHRLDHLAQDVHDVLRLDSSERPGEQGEIEGARLDLELLPGRDLVADPLGELGRKRPACPPDRLLVRVEGEHAARVGGDVDCQPAVAAAQLEYPFPTEVAEPAQCGDMGALGIDDLGQEPASGLYAFRVVPRAPNFCALRRVSSNFERA